MTLEIRGGAGGATRHCALQAGIGLLVNGALSLAFALAAARGRPVLPLWGARGMAVDFLPQFFMVGFATTLAVTLVTRAGLRAGRLGRWPEPAPRWLPRAALGRAVVLGTCAAIFLTPLAVGALVAMGLTALAAPAFVAMKVAVGAPLGALVAARVARWAMAEG